MFSNFTLLALDLNKTNSTPNLKLTESEYNNLTGTYTNVFTDVNAVDKTIKLPENYKKYFDITPLFELNHDIEVSSEVKISKKNPTAIPAVIQVNTDLLNGARPLASFNETKYNSIMSNWFNYEKYTIHENLSAKIEDDENIYIMNCFIRDLFTITDIGGQKHYILDDIMSIKFRFSDLKNRLDSRDTSDFIEPAATTGGADITDYQWFSKPPFFPTITIPDFKIQKITSNDVNSYANVKFPIYQTQIFNNDLFILISKNISNLSTFNFTDTVLVEGNPPDNTDRYKMKYIINNEAMKISYITKNNILNNYATYCDPGKNGSILEKLNEYSEKYIMGFYGITNYNILGTTMGDEENYQPKITDGYTTELNYNTGYNKINIYSTDHSNDPANNHETPNNFMAIYECKRHYIDFELKDPKIITNSVITSAAADMEITKLDFDDATKVTNFIKSEMKKDATNFTEPEINTVADLILSHKLLGDKNIEKDLKISLTPNPLTPNPTYDQIKIDKFISLTKQFRRKVLNKLQNLSTFFSKATKGAYDRVNASLKARVNQVYVSPSSSSSSSSAAPATAAPATCSKIKGWPNISLETALVKSVNVLHQYMDSHIDIYFCINDGTNFKYYELFDGTQVDDPYTHTYPPWKLWDWLYKDTGVFIEINNTSKINLKKEETRYNGIYQSIPGSLIYDFTLENVINNTSNTSITSITDRLLKDVIDKDLHKFIHTDGLRYGLLNKTTQLQDIPPTGPGGPGGHTGPIKKCFQLTLTGDTNNRWLRLPAFSIFNQLSIYKGNGDIAQELSTLTKFGGIYQNNNFQAGTPKIPYSQIKEMESYNDPLIQNELDLINVNIVNEFDEKLFNHGVDINVNPETMAELPDQHDIIILSKLKTFYDGIYPNPIPNKNSPKYFYDPMVLNNYSYDNLNMRQAYDENNYKKNVNLPITGSEYPFNFYGAYAYRYTSNTETNMRDITPYKFITDPTNTNNNLAFNTSLLGNKATLTTTTTFNYLSVSDKKYIPYDRFGNAPRAFVANDRLSGFRYIMLGYLGIKYFLDTTNPLVMSNFTHQLTNNINILSLGGYTPHTIDLIVSKFNNHIISKLYTTPNTDNEITNLFALMKPAIDLGLPPIPLLNYELINTGGKRKHTIKKINKLKNKKTYKKKYNLKKIQKKIIQKTTKKKHSKNHKKTIRKNIKKKIRKTYKNNIR